MRQYPIWNFINGQGKQSSANFGSYTGFTQYVCVGTSSRNSHDFARITVDRSELDDGTVEFSLYVDGILVKRGILDGSEFKRKELPVDDLANAADDLANGASDLELPAPQAN